jgi:hypothetical protein
MKRLLAGTQNPELHAQSDPPVTGIRDARAQQQLSLTKGAGECSLPIIRVGGGRYSAVG